jgi:hypothetical protein
MVALMVSGCSRETDQPVGPTDSGATTTSPGIAQPTTPPSNAPTTTDHSTSTTASTAAPTTTVAPTTTTLGPGERPLALSGYQLAMAAGCLEAAAMITFASQANDEWDNRQTGDAGTKDRLYTQTEQRLMGLVAWSRQLHGEVTSLQPPAGGGPVHATVEVAAARIADAAEAMLNGLQLPASAEEIPGTARRLARDAFETAALDFDQVAASTLEVDPAVDEYEFETIELRLTAVGLRHTADHINSLWDQEEIPFRHAIILLEGLAAATADLAARAEAVTAPPPRVDAYALVRNAANDLDQAAQAMLAGLLLPSEDEDVPGTARRSALDMFRISVTAFDRSAALALGITQDEWSPLPALPGPHLGPPDVIPPPLEVTKPTDGAGVQSRTVTLKGRSEPGAAISADDKTTYADDDGSWSLKVSLKRGHNDLTLTASDVAGNETVLDYQIHRGYLISRMRIGPADAGDHPDDVVPWFIDVFGTPHDDVLIILDEPNDPYGFWADTYFRIVTWRGPYVALLFADGNYYRFQDDDQPGLVAWYTDSDAFVTSTGIHEGSTLPELQAVYGSDLSIATVAECSALGEFWVTSTSFPRLRGQVSGPPFDADSVVTLLAGGAESSC